MTIGSQILDNGTLLISYYNANGKISFFEKRLMPHELYNWVESAKPTPDLNWNGKYVKKQLTSGKYVNQNRIQEIIMDKCTAEELALIYNDDNFPTKAYMDIEIKVDASNDFPDPDNVAMEVGLITFCGEDNVLYVLSSLDNEEFPEGLKAEDIKRMEDDTHKFFRTIEPLQESDRQILNQDFKIKHKFFTNETELMEFYFHKVAPKHSFLTGWNFTGYDWKYLMNRSTKKLKIDPLANFATDKVFSKNRVPVHLGLLDYMDVFDQLKPYKTIDNLTLDYIANLTLNASKLDHGYETYHEFQKDAYKYTLYNVIDVILVKMIEDKFGLLDVAFEMANIAQVDISRVFSPVHIAETLLCREFLSRRKKMMKKPWGDIPESRTYAGAYVMPPIPGHYDFIACYDFASMYPNIQIQWEISPDSYLGKICNLRLNGTEIITKAGTAFDGRHKSAAGTILTRLYNQRIDTKSEMGKLKIAV